MGKKRGNKFLVRHKRDLIWLGIVLIVIIVAVFFFMNNQKNPYQNPNAGNDAGKFKDSGDSGSAGSGGNNLNNGTDGTIPADDGSGGGSGGWDGGDGRGLVIDIPGGTDRTGGGNGTNGTNSTGPSLGGSNSSVAMQEIIFPYITDAENNKTINFTYHGISYNLKLWWGEGHDYSLGSLLKSGDRTITKLIYVHGENITTGLLEPGKVNLFDTNNDGTADIQLQFFYTLSGYKKVKIHNKSLEICSDGIDNDGNGLKDCHEESCHWGVGSDLPYPPSVPISQSRVLGYIWCTYGEERYCFDDFDNDGDSFIDIDDSDCVGRTCDWVNSFTKVYNIWSYLPEESRSFAPARRGCCLNATTYCVNIYGKCIPYDTYYETSSGDADSICGDNNSWDRCGPISGGSQVNKYPGNLSDGGDCTCTSSWWGEEYSWVCDS